ncbi:MAG TPA: hypothetical protein VHU61_04095, partial [Solirubrobacteraceae bacterium]|nr:hypothetical protein [Solirubrobacteraceae bacterium]
MLEDKSARGQCAYQHLDGAASDSVVILNWTASDQVVVEAQGLSPVALRDRGYGFLSLATHRNRSTSARSRRQLRLAVPKICFTVTLPR